ncbi:MAG TPA: sporulation protein YqfD, partial [Syntrophomonadaceae bacterium]|nr:sporulation protein YqfD [Syntrophomonadaceae bacterium]
AYEALKNIAETNDFELMVTDRQGLPFYKNLLQRRMGFVTGALIFILALYLLSSFVWFINITGNHNVSKNRILLTAARHGVYQGAAKWKFSRTEVENAMLRDIAELSYVQLDISGVKANIKVVEKILPHTDITGPCHMIAAKDGVVEDVLVLEGEANTKPGTVVARGDILISGIIFPKVETNEAGKPDENTEPYEVRARGMVKARVWYEGYGECRLRTDKKVYTGRKQNVIYLETPWHNFLLKGVREANYKFYVSRVKRTAFTTPAGKFGFYRIKMMEQAVKTAEYSETQAVDIARDRAMNNLARKMKEPQKITDSRVEILSSPSDPILRVKVGVETIEDIAEAKPIQTAENGN